MLGTNFNRRQIDDDFFCPPKTTGFDVSSKLPPKKTKFMNVKAKPINALSACPQLNLPIVWQRLIDNWITRDNTEAFKRYCTVSFMARALAR